MMQGIIELSKRDIIKTINNIARISKVQIIPQMRRPATYTSHFFTVANEGHVVIARLFAPTHRIVAAPLYMWSTSQLPAADSWLRSFQASYTQFHSLSLGVGWKRLTSKNCTFIKIKARILNVANGKCGYKSLVEAITKRKMKIKHLRCQCWKWKKGKLDNSDTKIGNRNELAEPRTVSHMQTCAVLALRCIQRQLIIEKLKLCCQETYDHTATQSLMLQQFNMPRSIQHLVPTPHISQSYKCRPITRNVTNSCIPKTKNMRSRAVILIQTRQSNANKDVASFVLQERAISLYSLAFLRSLVQYKFRHSMKINSNNITEKQ